MLKQVLKDTKNRPSRGVKKPSPISFFRSLEMASSPTIDLTTQLEYYAIRDTFLGRNEVKQDMKRAVIRY